MNCDKCGKEMLVKFIGQFYTTYECPVCGFTCDWCPAHEEEYEEGLSPCDIYGHDWHTIFVHDGEIAECARCGAVED